MIEAVLGSYSVTINVTSNNQIETIYEKSFTNNLDGSNKAINGALELLSSRNENELVGVLVVSQRVKFYDDGTLENDCMLFNNYAHFRKDKSDWVTVKEAKKSVREY